MTKIFSDPHEAQVIKTAKTFNVKVPVGRGKYVAEDGVAFKDVARTVLRLSDAYPQKGVLVYAMGIDQFGGPGGALCATYNPRSKWALSPQQMAFE